MKAVGYCRVSTMKQVKRVGEDRDEIALPLQQEKIRQKCLVEEWDLIETCIDPGRSGKSTNNRPGLQRALALAAEHKAVLIVYSLSRLSRSTIDTLQIIAGLHEAGADFVSVTEKFDTTTANGRLFFNICVVLANHERELTIERTNDGLDEKREAGEALGNTPYGFGKDGPKGKLILNEGELIALRLILSPLPGETYAGIARRLGASGHKPRKGAAWDRGVVRRIDKFYRGAAGIELLARFGLDPQGRGPASTEPGAQPGLEGDQQRATQPTPPDRMLPSPATSTAAAA